MLKNVTFDVSGPGGDKRAASVDRLKIVACDGKAVLGV